MARINLLPWRAERRKQRQKEFGIMLALSALGAVLLSFIIISYYSGQISGQNERNAFLREQITEVDKKITEIEELDKKKAKLLARKEVIEQLQSNRSQMVHLFDSLVRTIPDGAVLTSIKQDESQLTLEGKAQSNARVSTYMRNLEGSGWMTKPDLSIIEAKGDDKGLPYQFILTVTLANPNAPKDEDGDGVPDAPAAPAVPAPAPEGTTAPAAPASPAATPAQPGAAS
jgi:type IV pilus assembly protein PilN